jgi:hypothetical protein
MANTLPPMMNVLRDIAGVELPGYVGRITEEPATAVAAEGKPTADAARKKP